MLRPKKYPKPSVWLQDFNLSNITNVNQQQKDNKMQQNTYTVSTDAKPELVGYVNQQGTFFNLEQYKTLITKQGLEPVFKLGKDYIV